MTIKRLRIFEWQTIGDLAECFGVHYMTVVHRIQNNKPLYNYEIESRPVVKSDAAGHRTTTMYRAKRPQEQ